MQGLASLLERRAILDDTGFDDAEGKVAELGVADGLNHDQVALFLKGAGAHGIGSGDDDAGFFEARIITDGLQDDLARNGRQVQVQDHEAGQENVELSKGGIPAADRMGGEAGFGYGCGVNR